VLPTMGRNMMAGRANRPSRRSRTFWRKPLLPFVADQFVSMVQVGLTLASMRTGRRPTLILQPICESTRVPGFPLSMLTSPGPFGSCRHVGCQAVSMRGFRLKEKFIGTLWCMGRCCRHLMQTGPGIFTEYPPSICFNILPLCSVANMTLGRLVPAVENLTLTLSGEFGRSKSLGRGDTLT